jgi:hypothetical protein
MNPLFVSRMDYLLLRDFKGTAEQYRKDRAVLKAEVWETVRESGRYHKRLKNQGDLMSYEIDELVNNFIAPTDVPDVDPPDLELYGEIIEWAERESERPPGKKGSGG